MIVIVVSPLSSLMQDQVMALRRQWIKACCVNIGGKYSPIYSQFKYLQCTQLSRLGKYLATVPQMSNYSLNEVMCSTCLGDPIIPTG
jgi:superfamily II DNA helicase RecQ